MLEISSIGDLGDIEQAWTLINNIEEPEIHYPYIGMVKHNHPIRWDEPNDCDCVPQREA